jgi:hypothetical protein
MRINSLLLWSLNAVLPNGGVGIARPDQMSCGDPVTAPASYSAGSGTCVPQGFVVWLGRYVVTQENESLEALCARYKCTAGTKYAQFFRFVG